MPLGNEIQVLFNQYTFGLSTISCIDLTTQFDFQQ